MPLGNDVVVILRAGPMVTVKDCVAGESCWSGRVRCFDREGEVTGGRGGAGDCASGVDGEARGKGARGERPSVAGCAAGSGEGLSISGADQSIGQRRSGYADAGEDIEREGAGRGLGAWRSGVGGLDYEAKEAWRL